jgi:hypothetical protein
MPHGGQANPAFDIGRNGAVYFRRILRHSGSGKTEGKCKDGRSHWRDRLFLVST